MKQMRDPRVIAMLVLASCLLAGGCGWHMRGAQNIAPQLQQLRLLNPPQSATIARKLGNSLRLAGVELVNGAGTSTMQLGPEQRYTRKVSLDRNARSAEQEMRLVIEFELHDAEGSVIQGSRKLSASRIYAYDPNQVIAKRDEERLIYQELQDDLVAQLFRQFSRIDARTLEQNRAPPAT